MSKKETPAEDFDRSVSKIGSQWNDMGVDPFKQMGVKIGSGERSTTDTVETKEQQLRRIKFGDDGLAEPEV